MYKYFKYCYYNVNFYENVVIFVDEVFNGRIVFFKNKI